VREVLDNPKHTGYMVWNRRKRSRSKRGVRGRVNPAAQWVWSTRPTHEPLITRELFEAAAAVRSYRRGSRLEATPNRHRQTRRTYALRSYVVCDLCGRRMSGQMRKHYTYYRCGINAGHHGHQPWYDTHPRNVLIREDTLLEPVARFFSERIFGPHRKLLLADSLPANPHHELDAQQARLQAEITDLRRRRDMLMRELESYQPLPDPEIEAAWRDGLRNQFAAAMTAERAKTQQLRCTECPRWDSNPHCMDFESTGSAVGLQGREALPAYLLRWSPRQSDAGFGLGSGA
jgi:site-specific DNA recombinase